MKGGRVEIGGQNFMATTPTIMPHIENKNSFGSVFQKILLVPIFTVV